MNTDFESLFNLEEDEFLAGPERYALFVEGELDEELLVIDDIFAKTVGEILSDYPCSLADLSAPTAAITAPGYVFADHDAGVVLLDSKGAIAGTYLGPDVAILPEHRGQGLGSEFVLERVLRENGSPVWDLDRPCYTRAGKRAHLGAWRMMQDPAFRYQKAEALRIAYGHPPSFP